AQRRAADRRRGEPQLPLPSARAGARRDARAGRTPDRTSEEPDRPRALALPPRGRARARAAVVRGCARGRGETYARRARADARRVVLQPCVVELHVRLARAVRGTGRAVARALPARAPARRPERGPGRAPRRDLRPRAR